MCSVSCSSTCIYTCHVCGEPYIRKFSANNIFLGYIFALIRLFLIIQFSVPLVDHANGGGTPGRIVRRASLSTMSSEDGSIARIREEEEERSNSESDLSNVVPQSSASGGCVRWAELVPMPISM